MNVFKCFLQLDSLLHNIMSAGKLFQVTGAVHENERLANTAFVLGTVSSGHAAERVWREATCRTRCSLHCYLSNF